jgi:hypothetical protein
MKHIKVFEQFVNEGKVTKRDFEDVVKALQKIKHPVTVMFVPKWNEVEIIVGWNAPDNISDDVIDALDKAGIAFGGNGGVGISGDSSSYSRREYEAIERINGGHRDY